jgi:hypothetical protein
VIWFSELLLYNFRTENTNARKLQGGSLDTIIEGVIFLVSQKQFDFIGLSANFLLWPVFIYSVARASGANREGPLLLRGRHQ